MLTYSNSLILRLFHLMKGDFEQALIAFRGMAVIEDGPITAVSLSSLNSRPIFSSSEF